MALGKREIQAGCSNGNEMPMSESSDKKRANRVQWTVANATAKLALSTCP